MFLKLDVIKILIVLCVFVATNCPSFAINEMERLDINSDNEPFDADNSIELKIEKNDFSETADDISKIQKTKRKHLGEPTGTAFDLFRNSGYTFESGPIKNQKFRYFLHGGILFNAQRHDDLSSVLNIAANEFHSETLFADEKTKLMIAYNFSKNLRYSNTFFQKFSSLYLSHTFNEHQILEVGETRVPVGYEGGISSSAIRMYARSQVARNLGNYYSTGIKNMGDYKYMNYNIGIYDGSRSFCNILNGYEMAALVGFKPFADYEDKIGKLQIGASIDTGNTKNAFTVVGGHVLYDYKKLHADFEYLYADGLNGNYYGRGRAHGLYTTVGYFVHPKVELLARYDFYQNLSNEKVSQEYSAGLNYYFNPKVKFMMQYIYAMTDTSPIPSHKLYLGLDFTSAYLLDLL